MKHHVKARKCHEDSCSQFAIASATGLPLHQVLSELGCEGMTNKLIKDYLIRKGFANPESVTERDSILRPDLSGCGVLTIQKTSSGHALAYENGIIYDSNEGRVFTNIVEAKKFYGERLGGRWQLKMIIEVAPVKTREWAVGVPKKKEEELV